MRLLTQSHCGPEMRRDFAGHRLVVVKLDKRDFAVNGRYAGQQQLGAPQNLQFGPLYVQFEKDWSFKIGRVQNVFQPLDLNRDH